jgi:adenylosuccinate lyase
MNTYDHSTFISPFTWRYGSDEMKEIYSERHKRILLRTIWVSLAKAEAKAGLVTKEQVEELESNRENIDIDRATEIENEIHHDLMAEIKTYAEQCPKAGAIIHLGATSMDILDNMDAYRTKESLSIIIRKSKALLAEFVKKMEEYKGLSCMAFTHIQPAEITTVGYRFAQTAQDLIEDIKALESTRDHIRGKGLKGAVGTAASYAALLEGTGITAFDLEKSVMNDLNLESFDAATQIYTRKQDLSVVATLSSLAATLSRFALDFRILQSPPIGEWSEPFGKKQVGSSAMPFKRNPINCEKTDSLCRFISSQYAMAWGNATSMILERTLDDSANRRIMLPETFLATDEILITITKVVSGMNIHKAAVEKGMKNYGLFSATERLLMELGKKGANRQEMHEVIREESLKAWEIVQNGGQNPLSDNLSTDKRILAFLDKDEILSLLDASHYTGDAEKRTEIVIAKAKELL